MIENPMVRPIHEPIYRSPVGYKPKCECGCVAKLKIQGKVRCWECASDEYQIERMDGVPH